MVRSPNNKKQKTAFLASLEQVRSFDELHSLLEDRREGSFTLKDLVEVRLAEAQQKLHAHFCNMESNALEEARTMVGKELFHRDGVRVMRMGREHKAIQDAASRLFEGEILRKSREVGVKNTTLEKGKFIARLVDMAKVEHSPLGVSGAKKTETPETKNNREGKTPPLESFSEMKTRTPLDYKSGEEWLRVKKQIDAVYEKEAPGKEVIQSHKVLRSDKGRIREDHKNSLLSSKSSYRNPQPGTDFWQAEEQFLQSEEFNNAEDGYEALQAWRDNYLSDKDRREKHEDQIRKTRAEVAKSLSRERGLKSPPVPTKSWWQFWR